MMISFIQRTVFLFDNFSDPYPQVRSFSAIKFILNKPFVTKKNGFSYKFVGLYKTSEYYMNVLFFNSVIYLSQYVFILSLFNSVL